MSDSHSHSSQGSGLAGKMGRAVLACGIYAGLNQLFSGSADWLHGQHVEGILHWGAAAGAAVLHSGAHIAGHVIAHPVAESFFGHGEKDKSATGLNHDIERAVSRAAAQSIGILLGEWRGLHRDLRTNGPEDFALDELRDSCAAFLASKGDEVSPQIISDWLAALDRARFLDKPELGAAPWNDTPTTPAPEPPCRFADWFHWRYPSVFRLQFTEQLVRDDAARRKFQHALSQRILDFAQHNAAQVAAIRTQLDDLRTRLDLGDTGLVEVIAGRLCAELYEWQPSLVRAVTEGLTTDLFAPLKKWAADYLRDFETVTGEAEKRLKAEREAFVAAAKRVDAGITDLSHENDRLAHSVRALREQNGRAEFIEQCKARGICPPTEPHLPWHLQLDAYAIWLIRFRGGVELLHTLQRSDDDLGVRINQVFVEPEAATLRDPHRRHYDDEVEAREREHRLTEEEKKQRDSHRETMLGKEAAADLGGVAARRPAFALFGEDTQWLDVILGDPGAGKSTLLRLVALRWAEDHLRARRGRDGVPLRTVPLLVEVRELLAKRGSQENLSLLHYHCRSAEDGGLLHPQDLDTAIMGGQVALLVDGLDEAFVTGTRHRLREEICRLAARNYQLRITVTSRGFNFQAQPWRDLMQGATARQWTFHTIEPFDEHRILRFLGQWHSLPHQDAAGREHRRAAIVAAVRRYPHIRRLALNPMLLTLVCIVVRGNQADPAAGAAGLSRKAVYEEAENLILQRWNNAPELWIEVLRKNVRLPQLTPEAKRSFFIQVAAAMTGDDGPARDEERDSNQIHEDTLTAILTGIAPGYDPREVLAFLRERSYLLCFRGEQTYSFIHRSFLEYFTALGWAEEERNGGFADMDAFYDAVVAPHWKDATWHETLRFLIALLPNPKAVQCLDLLAAEAPIARDYNTHEPEPEGLVLASEFVQDLSPHVQTATTQRARAGAGQPAPAPPRRTKQEVAAPWRERLLAFALSSFSGESTSGDEDDVRRVLRQRALVAVGNLWREERGLALEFVRLVWEGNGRNGMYQSHFSNAIAAVWGGDGKVKAELLRSACGTDSAGQGCDADAYVRRRAVSALGSGWTGDAEVKAALLRSACGTDAAGSTRDDDTVVRRRAVDALGSGWAGDAEVKAALLRSAFGIGAAGLGRDPNADVRRRAVFALGSGWAGDAELKATLLRAVCGTDAAGSARDKRADVRSGAVGALGSGWAGNPEVKAALLRVAFGINAAGWRRDDDTNVRRRAVDALGSGWAGDQEVKAALLRAAFGTDAAGSGRDDDRNVRVRAVFALGSGWAGNAEVKAALLRAAFGTDAAGSGRDKDMDVRMRALDALLSGWAGDAEVKAALERHQGSSK